MILDLLRLQKHTAPSGYHKSLLIIVFSFGFSIFSANADDSETKNSQPTTQNEKTASTTHLSNRTLNKRIPMSTLLGTALGQSERASVFQWRKSPFSIEVAGSQIVEYNTFESKKLGLKMRVPIDSFHVTFGWGFVKTSKTAASEVIGKTPYRQAGRPSRHEFQLGGEMAIAEGISTWMPAFAPETQMVLYLTGDFSVAFYPKAWSQNGGINKLTSFFKPNLTSAEVAELSKSKLSGMAVNTTRYLTGLGSRLDLMSGNGFYFSSAFNLLIPIFKGENDLGYVLIPSIGAGYAFAP